MIYETINEFMNRIAPAPTMKTFNCSECNLTFGSMLFDDELDLCNFCLEALLKGEEMMGY